MKKIFLIFLLNLMLNNMSLADSFYFKECKLSSSVTGNYIINLEENVVEVELTSLDGKVQSSNLKIRVNIKLENISENDIVWSEVLDRLASAEGKNKDTRQHTHTHIHTHS